jgi:hypothetical protein
MSRASFRTKPVDQGFQRATRYLGQHVSGPGDEIRRQPVADRVGGNPDGLVLGVPQRALTGETLVHAGNIVLDMGGRAVGQHDFAGRDFHELVGCGDAANSVGRQSSDGIDHHRDVLRRYDNLEPVRRRNRAAGAIEIVLQGIAQFDRNTRLRIAFVLQGRWNQNLGKLVGDAVASGRRRVAGIERLPAPG